MKHPPIPPGLFVENRRRLAPLLARNSVVIVTSNDVMPTNADGTMPFRQNNDLLHLSGVDQPESILVLAPDSADEEHREVLFLRETTERIAVWEGHKLTREEAIKATGIRKVCWLDSFEQVLRGLILEADQVYLNSNEYVRAEVTVETRERRLIRQIQNAYPLHSYRRLAPLMHRLRARKSPFELELMQKACDITERGFRRVLGFVKPGVAEYEVEAEFIHEFLRLRADGFAYSPIIAAGGNACILHYVVNNQRCRKGDLLLLDVGASYANYAADMTRTIPVGGRFSRRQKAVYNAVLRVMRAGCGMLRPGVIIKEFNQEIGRLMEKELVDLGLLKAAQVRRQDPARPLYKKYFMHGTSHFLGLDVHDVGLLQQPIEEGMVFTVEPGIYIPEEKMGVRLENNILISAGGNLDLMKNIPIEAGEIEELMKRGGPGARLRSRTARRPAPRISAED